MPGPTGCSISCSPVGFFIVASRAGGAADCLEAKLAEVQAAKSKLIVASACLTTAFTSRYALFACFKLVQLLSSFIIQAILVTFTLAPSVAQVSIPS